MKKAEEILASEFDCRPNDLRSLTRKVDKSKIIKAMEAFGKMRLDEARQVAIREHITNASASTNQFIRTMNESIKENDDSKQCNNTIGWIKRVIDSCNNTIHFEYAQVLVDLFKEKSNDELEKLEIQDYYNIAFNEVHFVIR